MLATGGGQASPETDRTARTDSDAKRASSNSHDKHLSDRERRMSFWEALMRALASIHT